MPEFAPVAWKPRHAPPLEGPFAVNDRLAAAARWDTGGIGPEDVVIDGRGAAYTGLADGTILRFGPTGDAPEPIADAGGRPLGIEIFGPGELVVCNADLGLQRVTANGEVTVLVDSFDDVPLRFTNNATVAPDGTIYFSDTSTRWSIHRYVADLLEGQPTGRVFARRPDGTVDLIVDGLQFANGVALDDAGTTLYIAETGRYRIHRHDLGTNATAVFADNLPGFPDNLTYGDSTVWVALASPRQRVVDLMHPHPWLRGVSHRLPDALKPKPVRHGIVLGLDPTGTVVSNLQDSTGTVAVTTSARVHDGRLFVGTLTDPAVAVLAL